jgi:hypothetical protein
MVLLLASALFARADCVTTPCSEGINKIADCPDGGCTQTEGHQFDQELDRLKNIRSDERKPDLQSFDWIKGLPNPSPTDYTKCGNRDALRQIGEGKKATVMAWALHADTQGPESCNCDLSGAENHDSHIVLVDPLLKNPTLETDKSSELNCPPNKPDAANPATAVRSSIHMTTKHRLFTTSFASVYPHYVAKAEKRGRKKSEVDAVICWLTGYNQRELEGQLKKQKDFETFLKEAPKLNPSRTLIKGVICGVRVEDIQEPTMREIRYLDKLVDELAKGKAMDKIFRT